MAINDVSLTSGMRANLLSLQGTVDLLNRTQSRLSSGKKVNSAIDNPVSFFASQALTSRASMIDSLKDGMGQAIQTIQAADKGIKAITAMIEQAKGIAQAAQSAGVGIAADTQTITVSGTMATGNHIDFTGGASLSAGPSAVVTTVGTVNLDLSANTIDNNDELTIGGATFTAVTTTASTVTLNSIGVDLTGVALGNTVVVGGVTYTASDANGGTDFKADGTLGAAGDNLRARILATQVGAYGVTSDGAGNISITAAANPIAAGTVTASAAAVDNTDTTTTYAPLAAGEYLIGATGTATAANLAAAITDVLGTAYAVSSGAGIVTLTGDDVSVNANTAALGTGSTALEVAISTVDTTSAGPLADNEFAFSSNNIANAINMADAFNNSTNAAIVALQTAGYSMSADNGVVTLSQTVAGAATDVAAGFATVTGASLAAADVAGGTATAELTALQAQYNETLSQITALAGDSGYKGKNLLSADAALNTLEVKFEGNSLTVQGFNATATAGGLGITDAEWTTGGTIGDDIDLLDEAMSTMRQKSSELAGNLSVITVRNEFSTNMINTLTEGSDKLTLADANEEGANMLMLQTRQTLSTTALSMSAQAAQSVLRLFQ